MSILDRAELLLQAKNYSGSGDWLDESGNGHDAQLGSTSGADTNDPLFKPWNGTDYLYLPGTSGNYASTADVNLLDADSAHFQQGSGGKWIGNISNYGVIADATAEYGDNVWYIDPVAATFGWIKTASAAPSASFSVDPSTEYTLAMRVRFEDIAGDATHCTLVVSDYDSSQVGGDTSISDPVGLSEDWFVLSLTFTTAADAATIRPSVTGKNAGGAAKSSTATMYVDWAILQEGTSAEFVPSLRIVGDLDIEAKAAATDWTAAGNQTLIHKAASNNGYSLQITTGGELLGWHGDGTDYNPGTSSGASLTDGTAHTLRATLDVSDGTWTYYKDGSSFDTDSVGAVTPVADGTTAALVGAATSSTLLFAGDLYYVIVRDGIDGPVAAEYRASDASEPFATHTGSQDGRTWTHNRSASGLVSTVVDRDMFLLTTDDYMEIADDAALDFAADEALTVLAVVRPSTVAAGQDIAAAKKDNLTTSAGWALGRTTAASQFIIADGTADDDDTAGTMTANTLYTLAGVRNVTDDDIEAFLSGTGSGTPTTDSTTATLANALPVRIGATSNTAANFWEGQIVAVALFREALTDLEIAQVGNLLVSGGAEDFVVTFAPLARW